MTTAEILRASLELLEDPEHWTQGVHARDVVGHKIAADDPDARRWCMAGAVHKAAPMNARDALQVLKRALPDGYPSILNYNDRPDRQHSEVLDLIRRAIELAEAEEQHA